MSGLRWIQAVAFCAAAVCAPSAPAAELPDRVLLIPLDDRPAAWQFAQMIGDIAGVRVDTPPTELLGHFTRAGRADDIVEWLESNLSRYEMAVVSTDMLAYGGLIASRADRTSPALADRRLGRLASVLKANPRCRVYAFSTLTRLAPTAVKENSKWRLELARFAAMRTEYHTLGDASLLPKLRNLRAVIPAAEIERYDKIRARNHAVQARLLDMVADGAFTHLMFGQDDAQPIGPHVPETARLAAKTQSLGVSGKTFFASGIDQIANVLLSRALLDWADWSPEVRIVLADEQGQTKVASYESEPLSESLRDQVVGSKARISTDSKRFDYTLYVNTPEPREFALDAFLRNMQTEVDQGMPIAVADVNLGRTGTADSRVFDALMEGGRSSRLLAYAGWNTAGNTMGTTIPAANVYLLARRYGVNPLHRETALRKFILHRLVNDYEYHRFVRPQAYSMIDSLPRASREETYGPELARVDDLVRTDLGERLRKRFEEQMRGTRFFAGAEEFEVVGLKDVSIKLPWPRAYEVMLRFALDVQPVGRGR